MYQEAGPRQQATSTIHHDNGRVGGRGGWGKQGWGYEDLVNMVLAVRISLFYFLSGIEKDRKDLLECKSCYHSVHHSVQDTSFQNLVLYLLPF